MNAKSILYALAAATYVAGCATAPPKELVNARAAYKQASNGPAAQLAVDARNIVVEGHTDSQGADDYNLSLSQRRADSVRNYLVQQRYPAGRIEARGMGKGSPIADNGNAEGRANNRRVEIVIEREQKSAQK